MNFSQLFAPRLIQLINIFERQYDEAAFHANSNSQELFPNVAEVYNRLSNNRYDLEHLNVFMQNSVAMFKAGFPLMDYLKKIYFVTSNNSIFAFIDKNLDLIEQNKFSKAIFDILADLSSQAMLVKVFLEQQYISFAHAAEWNRLQNSVFQASVNLLELCSKVYLGKDHKNIRGVLMNPINAMKWFGYIFGDNSQIVNCLPKNQKIHNRKKNSFRFMKYSSIFLAFASAVLAIAGNANHRDLYIMILFLAIAAVVFFRYRENKLTNAPEQERSDAVAWLTSENIGEPYVSDLKINSGNTFGYNGIQL